MRNLNKYERTSKKARHGTEALEAWYYHTCGDRLDVVIRGQEGIYSATIFLKPILRAEAKHNKVKI